MTPQEHRMFAGLWLLGAVALLVALGIGHSYPRLLIAGAVVLVGYAGWELWCARRARRGR